MERVGGAIPLPGNQGLRIWFAGGAAAVIFWCWPDTRLRVEGVDRRLEPPPLHPPHHNRRRCFAGALVGSTPLIAQTNVGLETVAIGGRL